MDRSEAMRLRNVYEEAVAAWSQKNSESQASWDVARLAEKEYLEQRGIDILPWEAFPIELKRLYTTAMALDEQASKALRAASHAGQAAEDAWKLYIGSD